MSDVFGEIRSLLAKKHLPLEILMQDFNGIPHDYPLCEKYLKEKLLGWWWGQADDLLKVKAYLEEQAALHNLSFRHILYGKEVAEIRFKVEHFDWVAGDSGSRVTNLEPHRILINTSRFPTRLRHQMAPLLGGHLTDESLTKIIQAWLIDRETSVLLEYNNWIKQGHKPSYFDLPDREAVREATSWEDLHRQSLPSDNPNNITQYRILIGSTFWNTDWPLAFRNQWHNKIQRLDTTDSNALDSLKEAVEKVYLEADLRTFANFTKQFHY